ncbi:ATP-dependent RNA helicase DDX51-like [Brachionus plicatilis]|uniref:ATP-dependent RNA helicase n=1 Tax=Brachionus plicatilis TaxID=10195 RepID=A0A3M7PIY3_BRAPC|nr:ATP-dependent RNA helicase DDX51-like [Brachionus plicatilis]
MKLDHLFPVQKQVIPVILNQTKTQSLYPNDLCILAPTGSGKTLTFVLPIIKNLKKRIRPCCRALIVLPVSDLAEQVYNVFKSCIQDEQALDLINESEDGFKNNLKCMLLSNKVPFAKEQAQLINEEYNDCLIDIIVTTPGRLVDHIQKTKYFDLKNLRYLVLDECDRTMEQIKQNWLSLMNQAIFGECSSSRRVLLNNENLNVHNLMLDKKRLCPFQKILLSATLTRNPENLEQMKLFQPVYFSVGAEKLCKDEIKKSNEGASDGQNIEVKKLNSQDMADVSVPSELKEIFVQVIVQQKPLMAIYLIKTLGYKRMLVFVNSKETAKRLTKLFELNGIESAEYSSALHSARRKRIQSKFLDGKLDVLVCSDVMARGMDLENVDYVLMYDAPKHLSSYVHKAGRTARAGKSGMVITFLEHKEVYFFKKMVEPIGTKDGEASENKIRHKIKEIKIQKSMMKHLIEGFKNSLDKLKEELAKKPKSENNGEKSSNQGFNKRKFSNSSKLNKSFKKFKNI